MLRKAEHALLACALLFTLAATPAQAPRQGHSPALASADGPFGGGAPSPFQVLVPIANDDAYTVIEGRELEVNADDGVLDNDTGANAAILNTPPTNGTVALHYDGSFIYNSAPGFTGPATFSYFAQDADMTPEQFIINEGDSQAGVTISANIPLLGNSTDTESSGISGTITANVQPNAAPFSQIQVTGLDVTTTEDSRIALGFSNADSLIITAAAGAIRLTLDPPGSSASVSGGSFSLNDLMLRISGTATVMGTGQFSQFNDTQSLDTTAPVSLGGTISQNNGDLTLTVPFSITESVSEGAISVNFTLSGNIVAMGDTRPFTNSAAPATVTITVIPDEPPVAEADGYTVEEDNTLEVNAANGVLANDSDPEGETLTATVVDEPENGTLTLNANGSFTYEPDADFNGDDSFTYTAFDGLKTSEPVAVTITVESVNDAPTAAEITEPDGGATLLITEENEGDTFAVVWTESEDPDGDEVEYTWQLSTNEDFTAGAAKRLKEVLISEDTGTDTRFETTLGALDALLEAEGVEPGQSLTLYHRVLSRDGIDTTASEVLEITVERDMVVVGTEDGEELPTAFAVDQNYPNPFNPETVIAYALPKAAEVVVRIYDAAGREIAILREGVKAAGRYEVRFDGQGLPSGIYLYRLEAGDFSATKEMILVK